MALAPPYQSAPKLARHGVVRGVSLRYGGSSERPPPHRPEPPHRGPRRRFDGSRRSTPARRSRLADRARLCSRRDGFRHLPVGGGLATTAHRRGRRIRPRASPPRARGGDPKRRTPRRPARRRHDFGRAGPWLHRVTHARVAPRRGPSRAFMPARLRSPAQREPRRSTDYPRAPGRRRGARSPASAPSAPMVRSPASSWRCANEARPRWRG